MGFLFPVPPVDYEFPSCKAAFVEASQSDLQGSWSSGAVYNARMAVGPTRCKKGAIGVVDKFNAKYLEFCAMIRNGQPLRWRCYVRDYDVRAVNEICLPPVVRLRSKGVAASALQGLKDSLR